MTEWTADRIRELHKLVLAGRAGIWLHLEGGPCDGRRGYLPHIEWQFLVVVDREGRRWSMAYPPDKPLSPTEGQVIAAYRYDAAGECMVVQDP